MEPPVATAAGGQGWQGPGRGHWDTKLGSPGKLSWPDPFSCLTDQHGAGLSLQQEGSWMSGCC